MLPVVKARFSIRPERVKASRAKVEAAFDFIEREAGPNGYLVGDSFSVADLTAASILTPLVVPPQFEYIKLPPERRSAAARAYRDSLKDHPGYQWVLDMYERHRSPSAELGAAATAAATA
jgi:glutathione S-transferase